MQKVSSGAEAVIYLDKNIVKDRVEKRYRIPEIDRTLRQFRTRRESKILERLEQIGFPAPRLVKTDRSSVIEMEYLDGPKLRDIMEKSDYIKLAEEIGRKVAVMHNNDIVHGDLTTSNMMMMEEIFFIDFGLSQFSDKVEDKAVDIHLFRQALESKHNTIWEKSFKAFIDSYIKYSNNSKSIMRRLEKIELRGRNKAK